ncbi:GntR family transcriptional regulator [Cupriavidus basilensis]
MYSRLYDAIMEHRLPPRTKLTEHSLCEIYATARHTVRKVLAHLAADGMVDLEPNRGAFYRQPLHRRSARHVRTAPDAGARRAGKACRHARRQARDRAAAQDGGGRAPGFPHQ